MRQILTFDLNETLLDLSALDSRFEKSFGSQAARKEWFGEVLQLAFVSVITGDYSDFGTICKAALEVIEQRHRRPLLSEQRGRIFDLMRKLPPHPDVTEGLQRLQSAGMRMVVLTNSPPQMAEAQLGHAGLRGYFERVFSADSVRRLKPAPEVYRQVADALQVGAESLLMVAAHSWDIAGAMHAGCGGAFIARPRQVLNPLAPQPSFVAGDLRDFAGQIASSRVRQNEVRNQSGGVEND